MTSPDAVQWFSRDHLRAQAEFIEDYKPLLRGESCHGWSGPIPSRVGATKADMRKLLHYLYRPYVNDLPHLVCVVAGLKPIAQIGGAENMVDMREQIKRAKVRFTDVFYRAHSMCGMGLVTGSDGTCNVFYRPEEWPRAYVYHMCTGGMGPVHISIPDKWQTTAHFHMLSSYLLGYSKTSSILSTISIAREITDVEVELIQSARGKRHSAAEFEALTEAYVMGMSDSQLTAAFDRVCSLLAESSERALVERDWSKVTAWADKQIEYVRQQDLAQAFMRAYPMS